MGNFYSVGGHQNPGQEVPRPQRVIWPGGLDLTWADFQRRRESPYAPEMSAASAINGLIFGDILVPDNVLELILSLVRPEDILNCNLVCRNWKDIITRKSYWKLWFDRNKWDWSMIPSHIKDKPQAWIVLHAQVRHGLFTKNLIRNHSGEGDRRTEFRDWTIHRNGGDRWKLEPVPVGCDPLPPDPFFDNSTSAWVTSYQPASKWISIDLWEAGLTPPVMMTCLPFSLVCSQMYTARFDCGGVFTWTLRILDRGAELIQEFSNQYQKGPGTEWVTATHPFQFREEHLDKMDQLRGLVFMHEGRDDRTWKGHYGIKFSRSSIKIQLDNPTRITPSPEKPLSQSQDDE